MSIVPQLIVNSIIAASIFMLVAFGFNLAYATTKFFNMAHGSMAVVGGYVVFWLTSVFGLNLYLSIALGILAAGIVAYGLEKAVYLQLRKKKASDLALLIASLGIFSVIQAVTAMLFSSQYQALSQLVAGQKTFQIFGASITAVQGAIFVAGMLIMLTLALVLKWTTFGKQVRAIADDEEVAKIIGINTNRVIAHLFFLTGALGGLAGIMTGLDTGIDPVMGLNLILYGIIASIVGGVGNVYGSVLGALLVGFAENFGILFIPGEWKRAIAYGVLILFLIFRPQGILGRKK